jgi:hypothetical protein
MLSHYPNNNNNESNPLQQLSAVNSLQMVPLPASPNRRPSPALHTQSNSSTAMGTPGMGSANVKNNPYLSGGNSSSGVS